VLIIVYLIVCFCFKSIDTVCGKPPFLTLLIKPKFRSGYCFRPRHPNKMVAVFFGDPMNMPILWFAFLRTRSFYVPIFFSRRVYDGSPRCQTGFSLELNRLLKRRFTLILSRV